jgi:hypothetical protein
MTTNGVDKKNTLVLGHYFLMGEPPDHPLLYKHVLFCNLFYPWLFYSTQQRKITTNNSWALISNDAGEAKDKGFVTS